MGDQNRSALKFGNQAVLRENCREDMRCGLSVKPAEDIVHKKEVRSAIDGASQGL